LSGRALERYPGDIGFYSGAPAQAIRTSRDIIAGLRRHFWTKV